MAAELTMASFAIYMVLVAGFDEGLGDHAVNIGRRIGHLAGRDSRGFFGWRLRGATV